MYAAPSYRVPLAPTVTCKVALCVRSRTRSTAPLPPRAARTRPHERDPAHLRDYVVARFLPVTRGVQCSAPTSVRKISVGVGEHGLGFGGWREKEREAVLNRKAREEGSER